jgi:hypothetical protein
MAKLIQFPEYTLVAGGVTNNISMSQSGDSIVVSGTATITANNTFTTTDTPVEGHQIWVLYKAAATYNGGAVVIFGKTLTANQALNDCVVKCYYNGASWDVYISSNYEDNAFVGNDQVKPDAAIVFSKLATLTASRIPQLNASGIMEASSVPTTFLALLGALTQTAADYNRVASTTALTADLNLLATLAAAGLTTAEIGYLIGVTSNIQTQLNTKANIADFTGVLPLKYLEVIIPSAQVLTANATPVVIIGAPAPSEAIEILYCSATMIYAGVAYTTNGVVQVRTQGATVPQIQFSANQFLFGTASRTVRGTPITPTLATETQIIAGAPIEFFIETGNPAAGTSDVTIRMIYYEG